MLKKKLSMYLTITYLNARRDKKLRLKFPSQFHHTEVGKTWYFGVYLGIFDLARILAKY